MNAKTRKIIGWILSILIVIFLAGVSAPMKLGLVEDKDGMFEAMGLTGKEPLMLGIVEIICALLFLFPKTGVIGTLLLASYFGGVIATHLEHDNNIIFGIVFAAIVWMTAFIRYPELSARILGKRLP
jgi:hypothetical protein